MRTKVWVILAGLLLLAPVCGYAGEADALYAKGIQAARSGRIDFAFMYYNQLDREYPRSPLPRAGSSGQGRIFL